MIGYPNIQKITQKLKFQNLVSFCLNCSINKVSIPIIIIYESIPVKLQKFIFLNVIEKQYSCIIADMKKIIIIVKFLFLMYFPNG